MSVCFTVVVERVPPSNKNTDMPGDRQTDTQTQAIGSRSTRQTHWTVDLSQTFSSSFPFHHSVTLFCQPRPLPLPLPRLPAPSAIRLPHIYTFSYAPLCTSRRPPSLHAMFLTPPPVFRCSSLAFCLPYCCCGFLYCAVFPQKFSFFLFYGIQHIYISDVRNKRNLYIQ